MPPHPTTTSPPPDACAHDDPADDDLDPSAPSPSGFSAFLRRILGKDVDSLRIAIPVFLLEPVSGLEFVSDLGRMDNVATAAARPTPLLRLCDALRLVLASLTRMYLRRQSKKPFNPVLGETILAAYVPAPSSSLPPSHLVGEQVSHHPPISVFHLSCADRNVNGTLTFSLAARFTGLSFALTNHSNAMLHLRDLDEIYYVTYPDAMVAGILSMSPRFLWTGSFTAHCPKTRLRAKVTFKDQRLIGRDVHDLTGVIERYQHLGDEDSSSAETLGVISGAWNKEVVATLSDGSAVVLSTCGEQSEYEYVIDARSTCRRTWRDVVDAMKRGDSAAAKRAKCDIEDSQRALERLRATGHAAPFKPRFFVPLASLADADGEAVGVGDNAEADNADGDADGVGDNADADSADADEPPPSASPTASSSTLSSSKSTTTVSTAATAASSSIGSGGADAKKKASAIAKMKKRKKKAKNKGAKESSPCAAKGEASALYEWAYVGPRDVATIRADELLL